MVSARVGWSCKITDLGALATKAPCSVYPGASDGSAAAINRNGLIVGYSDSQHGRHATLWTLKTGG